MSNSFTIGPQTLYMETVYVPWGNVLIHKYHGVTQSKGHLLYLQVSGTTSRYHQHPMYIDIVDKREYTWIAFPHCQPVKRWLFEGDLNREHLVKRCFANMFPQINTRKK